MSPYKRTSRAQLYAKIRQTFNDQPQLPQRDLIIEVVDELNDRRAFEYLAQRKIPVLNICNLLYAIPQVILSAEQLGWDIQKSSERDRANRHRDKVLKSMKTLRKLLLDQKTSQIFTDGPVEPLNGARSHRIIKAINSIRSASGFAPFPEIIVAVLDGFMWMISDWDTIQSRTDESIVNDPVEKLKRSVKIRNQPVVLVAEMVRNYLGVSFPQFVEYLLNTTPIKNALGIDRDYDIAAIKQALKRTKQQTR